MSKRKKNNDLLIAGGVLLAGFVAYKLLSKPAAGTGSDSVNPAPGAQETAPGGGGQSGGYGSGGTW